MRSRHEMYKGRRIQISHSLHDYIRMTLRDLEQALHRAGVSLETRLITFECHKCGHKWKLRDFKGSNNTFYICPKCSHNHHVYFGKDRPTVKRVPVVGDMEMDLSIVLLRLLNVDVEAGEIYGSKRLVCKACHKKWDYEQYWGEEIPSNFFVCPNGCNKDLYEKIKQARRRLQKQLA